ncbi:MAG: hypothetical protein ACON4M_05455 [Crocinitomicaceae bacterium]
MSNEKKISLIQFGKTFFPIQLIVGHIKYNLLAIFYWSLLFLIVSDNFGSSFGVPYLFLSPEYLGSVNEIAFFLVGFSIGGFTMGFNTYSYIKLGPHYPFLLVVRKPFLKFSVNNSLLPLIFILFYIYKIASFQSNEELNTPIQTFIYILSFIGGIGLFMLFSLLYFFPKKQSSISALHSKNDQDYSTEIPSIINEKSYIYIGKNLRFFKSRSVKHLDEDLRERIFNSNKINTSLFEVITIATFISIGLFREYSIFEIPASMSIILLFTVILMLFSAMLSWFRRWTYPILFIAILAMDYFSVNTNMFTYKSYAYGLNYEEKNNKEYSLKTIKENDTVSELKTRKNYINILNEWKKQTGQDKPKLVITNSSGGGSRSALWTFTVLQKADEQLKGKLSRHIQLMTGASGGMVGAAYFRELMLRSLKGEIKNMHSGIFRDKISKDLLNKLAFALSTNDLFFRYADVEIDGNIYAKDRGYAFEEQLHKNTDNFLNHNLGYYSYYERKGAIPIIVFTPTIVNDGRRMLISSQSLQFLTSNQTNPKSLTPSYENIDFQYFFRDNYPNNVRFSSVIRSQATFPFVLPMLTLPTNPGVQLMDAGLRDNYGGKMMIEFLYDLQDWIDENTSGVIILQIRDTKKLLYNETYQKVSMLDKITLPFGNMYKNFTNTQDFNQEELLKVGTTNLKFPVEFIEFNLRENKRDRISLSWHLTKNEKQKIERAFKSSRNQASLKKLSKLLNK